MLPIKDMNENDNQPASKLSKPSGFKTLHQVDRYERSAISLEQISLREFTNLVILREILSQAPRVVEAPESHFAFEGLILK